jgi:hypothetical protein
MMPKTARSANKLKLLNEVWSLKNPFEYIQFQRERIRHGDFLILNSRLSPPTQFIRSTIIVCNTHTQISYYKILCLEASSDDGEREENQQLYVHARKEQWFQLSQEEDRKVERICSTFNLKSSQSKEERNYFFLSFAFKQNKRQQQQRKLKWKRKMKKKSKVLCLN